MRLSKIDPVLDQSHDVVEASVRWYLVPIVYEPPTNEVALNVRRLQAEAAEEPGPKYPLLTYRW